MTDTMKSGITAQLLMGDAVLLLQAIKARMATMDAVDTESIDEDALAEMYDDRDALQRLHDYIEHEYRTTFEVSGPINVASYESDLS